MYIDLVSHADSSKSNMVFTDFFTNHNFKVILLTHHASHTEFNDSLNSLIINDLIDAKLDEVPKEKLKKRISEYVLKINEKLYSKYQQNHSIESGLSLLLCIVIGKRAYVVQFGRFVCGLLKHSLKIIGNEKRNVSENSTDDTLLLGKQKELSTVPIQFITFDKNSYFVVIPSTLATELIELDNHPKKILSQIQLYSQNEKFPYFILKAKPLFMAQNRYVFKNFRIRLTAFILLLVIILSTLYVFYGKNWLADQQNLLRMKNQEFVRNELLEKVIAAQEVMNQTLQEVYQLEIFPNQKLEFKESVTYEYTGKISGQPHFDMHSLYFISGKKAISLRKKIGTLKWEKEFEKEVKELMLVDANRLLILTADKNIYCLNRETGYQIWQQKCDYDILASAANKKIFQISINRFKQLESSLILIPGKRKITLVNTMNGEVISTLEFEQDIQFISEFDLIERSLFIVQNEQVKQIRLEIKY